jgi:hypothetical protein
MHQNATVAAILKMNTQDKWLIEFLRPPDDEQVAQLADAQRHPFAALYNGSCTLAKPAPASHDSQRWKRTL